MADLEFYKKNDPALYQSMLKQAQHLRTFFDHAVCGITFQKQDGTSRTMTCTRAPAIVPPRKGSLNESRERKDNTLVIVWDMEKQAWRSFRSEDMIRLEEGGYGV